MGVRIGIGAMFEDLAERANKDAHLRRIGRNCSAEFVLAAGDTPTHVVIRGGEVTLVRDGPFKMRSSAFRIAASRAAWEAFMEARPKPGFHDIFAMSATGAARIEGDMDVLLGHLAYFKALLATLRREA